MSLLCVSEHMCAFSCPGLVSHLKKKTSCALFYVTLPPSSVTSPGLGSEMSHLESQLVLPVDM